MTKTANKGGLRAAAIARTNRHAQRTALPPKAGKVDEAREAIATAKGIESGGKSGPTADKPGAAKSGPKADAFGATLDHLGWDVTIEPAPGTEPSEDVMELTAKRGSEVIWISWTAGALTLEPMPTYTIEDRTVKLRNASAARKIAERDPDDAAKELNRVATNKHFRRKPTEPKRGRLPFDPALATDEEVIERLAGRVVSWHNRLTENTETAQVGREREGARVRRVGARSLVEIEEIDGGDRIVKFCCPTSGFRAFRLSALVKVSR